MIKERYYARVIYATEYIHATFVRLFSRYFWIFLKFLFLRLFLTVIGGKKTKKTVNADEQRRAIKRTFSSLGAKLFSFIQRLRFYKQNFTARHSKTATVKPP
jgi:hypothetical protein